MSAGPDTTLLTTVEKKKFEESDYFIWKSINIVKETLKT
jgi:hypothetical protein